MQRILLLYPDESGIITEFITDNTIARIAVLTPIICVSNSPLENNRARSLKIVADEFLIEPISGGEIVATVDQLISSSSKSTNRDVLTIGDLTLDRTTLVATLRNVRLPLYPVQVRVLELLMLNPGRAVTRQEISNEIWATGAPIDKRTVDVSIGRIRAALRHKVTVDPIRTIRSVGYSFNEHFADVDSLPSKRGTMKRV